VRGMAQQVGDVLVALVCPNKKDKCAARGVWGKARRVRRVRRVRRRCAQRGGRTLEVVADARLLEQVDRRVCAENLRVAHERGGWEENGREDRWEAGMKKAARGDGRAEGCSRLAEAVRAADGEPRSYSGWRMHEGDVRVTKGGAVHTL
jgi:hypothetical protein